MNYKVFYSWQSDSPNATNRGFIGDALEKAATVVAKDESVGVAPIIDRDTKGIPGSPEIGATIFNKIDASQAFVCDVSIINPGAKDRLMPNPNVMLELGYAAKSLSWDNIVMVFNTAYGSIQDLPFDLRTRRVVPYEAREGESDRSAIKMALSQVFGDALRAMVQNKAPSAAAGGVEVAPISPAIRTIQAVEEGRTNQAVETRRFMTWVVEELDRLAPQWISGTEFDEQLIGALESSIPLAEDFARVSEAIAGVGAAEPSRVMYRGFEQILEKYDLPRGFSGHSRNNQFDYYKFMGHELFTMFVATLLSHARWQLLADLLDEEFHPQNVNVDRQNPAKAFTALSTPVALLDTYKERLKLSRISVRADVLKDRHVSGPLATVSPLQAFLDADFFLFIRGEAKPLGYRSVEWIPWSSIYLSSPPRFLWDLQRKRYAETALPALGLTSETATAVIKDAIPLLSKLWGGYWDNEIARFDPATIASK